MSNFNKMGLGIIVAAFTVLFTVQARQLIVKPQTGQQMSADVFRMVNGSVAEACSDFDQTVNASKRMEAKGFMSFSPASMVSNDVDKDLMRRLGVSEHIWEGSFVSARAESGLDNTARWFRYDKVGTEQIYQAECQPGFDVTLKVTKVKALAD
ncbi:uncharacterized protein LOC129596049 [Paramacrobiotus metropolitanus]|uniref:uncharacterized protein LOC129596049 n=1 Tax=Paramacrobiotus metropolitanus TaxID=2943436 RepID=UPI0024461FAA|nr:uncharacterized protein LOC129596049 [Paramacrobiotus metropolitanus]